MCGICGTLVHTGGEAPSPDLLKRMADAICHRGPDGQQFFQDGPLGFGHDRLSIIDVAGGAQPMSNEDRTIWICYNGEIYNFRELQAELEARGHRFATRCDTEVVVHLYEDLGEAAFARLNGIFSFALWDSRSQRLLLVRDPFGTKPLYYTDHHGRISFASEIKALIQDPELPRAVDLTALDWFLTYRFVPSPRTMLAAVKKVPAGHFLRVQCGETSLVQYAPQGLEPPRRLPLETTIELVRDGFSAAVKRQMVSDVNIGALLSGGVDSSAIVAVMAEASTRVRTYTVGFAEGGEFNELAEAREVATMFATDHHELLVSAREYAEILPKVIWHLDEPISTTSAIPLYFITRVAKADVKVALAGQGADEPFAGYQRYLGERYRQLWSAIPGVGRALGQELVSRVPRAEALKRAVRSLAIADDAERFRQIYAVFPDALKHQLMRPELRGMVEEPSVLPIHRLLPGLERISPLARMQYVDARLSLADDLLMYGDKMSMANSIEMRVPFLDLDFMRLVESIPPEQKLKGRTGKYVWKRAAERWLPRRVIDRPKKGFATPIDGWFRGSLNPFVRETLLGQNAAVRRYFDAAVLARMIQDHQDGRENYQRQLFSLVSFEIWHQQFIGAA